MEDQKIDSRNDQFDITQLEFDVINYSREKFQQQMHVQLDILVISKLVVNRQKSIKKTIFEIQSYLNLLYENRFFLLSEIKSEDINVSDPSNDKQIEASICKIKNLLLEIQDRKDILFHKETHNFFEFAPDDLKQCSGKNLIYKRLPPYTIQYLPHNLEDLQVWSAYYCPNKDNLIACTLSNKTPLGKLGRVWSIIETDILGAIIIYQQRKESPQLKYRTLFQKCFDQRILSLIYLKNQIVFGSHLGYLGFLDIVKTAHEIKVLQDSIQKISIGSDAIIGLYILDKSENFILGVSPLQIKILEMQGRSVVQGGSLKQRLVGGEISSATVCQSSMKIYLGTSKGNILIYQFIVDKGEKKLQFLEEMYIAKDIIIDGLQISRSSNLFIKLQKESVVYKLHSKELGAPLKTATFEIVNPSQNISQQNMKCIEYIADKNFFLCGYSNGMLCIWNSANGEIASCVQITNSSEINFLYHDSGTDTLLVGHDFGVVILKFGDIDKVMQEV